VVLDVKVQPVINVGTAAIVGFQSQFGYVEDIFEDLGDFGTDAWGYVVDRWEAGSTYVQERWEAARKWISENVNLFRFVIVPRDLFEERVISENLTAGRLHEVLDDLFQQKLVLQNLHTSGFIDLKAQRDYVEGRITGNVEMTKAHDGMGRVVMVPKGRNDSEEDNAFINGLALFAVAIEGEHDKSLQILNAFLNDGFDESGEPVRPFAYNVEDQGTAQSYSIDQFLPQLVGIHFAWKHGDPDVKYAAREVMGKWIDVLNENGGRLGSDDGSNGEADQVLSNEGNTLLAFLVSDVAQEMGLSYSAPLFKANTGLLKDAVQELIVRELGRVQWESPLTGKVTLPLDLRKLIASAITGGVGFVDALVSSNTSSVIDRSIRYVPIDKLGVGGGLNDLKTFLRSVLSVFQDLDELTAVLAGYSTVASLYGSGNPKVSPETGHLFYWEALLYDDLHPLTEYFLQPFKQTVKNATAQNRWWNYYLLAGDAEKPLDVLLDWPDEYVREYYMFKGNRSDQDESFSDTDRDMHPRPQLDYVVLHALARHFGHIK